MEFLKGKYILLESGRVLHHMRLLNDFPVKSDIGKANFSYRFSGFLGNFSLILTLLCLLSKRIWGTPPPRKGLRQADEAQTQKVQSPCK
jgi:hypothetical protein